VAIAVGITGFLTNLMVALVGALILWWAAKAIFALRDKRRQA
jgi:hypothetical protein